MLYVRRISVPEACRQSCEAIHPYCGDAVSNALTRTRSHTHTLTLKLTTKVTLKLTQTQTLTPVLMGVKSRQTII